MFPQINLAGQRFGKLLASHARRQGRRTYWLCLCDCGQKLWIRADALRRETQQNSCGCVRRRFPRTGPKRHGMSGTPEHAVWRSMITRCTIVTDTNYPRYGARGIQVCARWLGDFTAFLSDMGQRPTRYHSIERKNNNGNYEPGNCIWAERKAQQRNTRRNRHVVIAGERMTLADAVDRFGGKYDTVKRRLQRGWTASQALGLSKRGSNTRRVG